MNSVFSFHLNANAMFSVYLCCKLFSQLKKIGYINIYKNAYLHLLILPVRHNSYPTGFNKATDILLQFFYYVIPNFKSYTFISPKMK